MRQFISLEQIADYSNLVLAFHKAAKGKRYRRDVQAFLKGFNHNLGALGQAIREGQMPCGRFRAFTIYDPKQRIIHAACFEDRIFHHAVMNIAGETLEKAMSPFSYACRPEKGVHKAVEKVQKNLQRFSHYAKIDIAGYFAAIDHKVLLQVLSKRYKGQAFLQQVKRIISSHNAQSGVGLPIGSLTSQYFANSSNRNRNIGFRFAVAQHGIGITVKDQSLIRFCSLRINKNQGCPWVSSSNESSWDDRFWKLLCLH